ncbi:T9SS type A sorting domain-containing protein [candidate division KSB1 bacterium]|nr:T9SS type A sorting domain-containing protein [candidate division KSB1 bacterium]
MKTYVTIVFMLSLLCGTVLGYGILNTWINEFHYENTGMDTNEFIEVVTVAAYSVDELKQFTVSLYQGSNGKPYWQKTLDEFSRGDVTPQGFVVLYYDFTGDVIRNGAPGGITLDFNGALIHSISFEGSFKAAAGPAHGWYLPDIRVFEDDTTPANYSIQLVGNGLVAGSFIWAGPGPATKGSVNPDQSLPVELFSFIAYGKNDFILLKWVTFSEVNNVGFLVERRPIGEEAWQLVASYRTHQDLLGKGTTAEVSVYTFKDTRLEPYAGYEYRLGDADLNGAVNYTSPIRVRLDYNHEQSPEDYALAPAYPNPFNPETHINYQLKRDAYVELVVSNLLGHSVRTLVSEHQASGYYTTFWNGRNDNGILLSSGVYFITLKTEDFTFTRKVIKLQ